MIQMTNTYLLSVRPTWADAFFLDRNPKSIELRKGSFGASLKPGDVIAIYATMPTAEVLGIVRVLKRERLPINCGANLSKGNWQKYHANSSRLTTQTRNRVLVFGLALPNSSPVRSHFFDFARTGAIAGSHRSRFNN
jgi:hypothetical protein